MKSQGATERAFLHQSTCISPNINWVRLFSLCASNNVLGAVIFKLPQNGGDYYRNGYYSRKYVKLHIQVNKVLNNALQLSHFCQLLLAT